MSCLLFFGIEITTGNDKKLIGTVKFVNRFTDNNLKKS
jgi:hypothetical protein